jgi:hypothetical protein
MFSATQQNQRYGVMPHKQQQQQQMQQQQSVTEQQVLPIPQLQSTWHKPAVNAARPGDNSVAYTYITPCGTPLGAHCVLEER